MNPSHWPRRGLYAITPDEADTGRLCARVEPVLAAGAVLVQYRNKAAATGLRLAQARMLLALCRRFGVPLIVNDDIELAVAVGADGAHVGEHDADLRAARDALGVHAILGASCYDDPERAARAAASGADYLAFGAFHPSPTKPQARTATPELLRDARRFGLPLVAIGGLRPDNARAVIDAGADLIAVISGVFDAPDPAAMTRAYSACFEPHPHPGPPPQAGEGEETLPHED